MSAPAATFPHSTPGNSDEPSPRDEKYERNARRSGAAGASGVVIREVEVGVALSVRAPRDAGKGMSQKHQTSLERRLPFSTAYPTVTSEQGDAAEWKMDLSRSGADARCRDSRGPHVARRTR